MNQILSIGWVLLLCACGSVDPVRLGRVPSPIARSVDTNTPFVTVFVDVPSSHCRRQFAELLEFQRRHPEVALRYHFVPSTQRALKTAEVAVCAKKMGVPDGAVLELLLHPAEHQEEAVRTIARTSTEQAALVECVENPNTANLLLNDVSISQHLEVTGLPTVYVREERFDGVASASALAESVRRQWPQVLSVPSQSTIATKHVAVTGSR